MANDDFLNPLDALIPTIPFSFCAELWVQVTSEARGSVSVGFLGSRQLSPFWGGGASSQRAVSTPLPQELEPCPPFPCAARPLQAVLSEPIRAGDCGRSEFFVPGDVACRACVRGAVCNGTDRLVTAPNFWWAHRRTLTFHECGAARPCVGGAETGRCARGFSGPLCGACAAGHAGERCVPCPRPATAWLLVGGWMAVYVVGAGFIILSALKKGYEHKGNHLLITFKILMMYLQVRGACH